MLTIWGHVVRAPNEENEEIRHAIRTTIDIWRDGIFFVAFRTDMTYRCAHVHYHSK